MDEIKVDLRGNKKVRSRDSFALEDINYARGLPFGSEVSNRSAVKMVLIEKQPKYPTYTEALGDFVYGIPQFIVSGLSKEFGRLGTLAASQSAQVIGKAVTNNIVSGLSQSDAADAYWNNFPVNMNHFANLFVTETRNGIISYELPFFSDYWIRTDGESGWKRGGAEMILGRNLGGLAAKIANVGYPSTPDWEYSPIIPELSFEFHLLNETTKDLTNHLKWLVSILSGTMYVQINGADTSALTNALADSFSGGQTAVVDKVTGGLFTEIAKAVISAASFYKSPNVYEVIVPGRLHWLWSTLGIEVSCVGKLFYDNQVSTGLAAFDSRTPSNDTDGLLGIAFPEAFKVTVKLRSLLPQSFNEFNFFLMTSPTSRLITDTTAFADPAMGAVVDLLGGASKKTQAHNEESEKAQQQANEDSAFVKMASFFDMLSVDELGLDYWFGNINPELRERMEQLRQD